ncbi:SRPBCC domain-containing protein [Chitinophaga sp. GCM10012297]|uniref:SRPBCC domain-containing protein n=1 Tax=Chitinophaga chungangae TaxID=2821488 RepID=A0ABS3YBM9_9BACT|nr:SRPBCC domain-containing protein [Chitinophaga chungangae]MBO9152074.1 SRPBCC domain-containing protein [Chitinophaga chungangae]
MKHEPLVVERTYNAPPSRVWEAITDRDKMKEWYFNLSDFRAEVGFEFSFPGQGHDGKKFIHLCRVTEVIPGKKLSHTWKYENLPGESVLTWELFPEGDGTRVKLTHAGLETFPQNDPNFSRASFTGGWNDLLGKYLKEFVEK